MNPHENELDHADVECERRCLKGKTVEAVSPIILLEMGEVSTNPHGWFMNGYDIALLTVNLQ